MCRLQFVAEHASSLHQLLNAMSRLSVLCAIHSCQFGLPLACQQILVTLMLIWKNDKFKQGHDSLAQTTET